MKRFLLLVLLVIVLAGCATMREELSPGEEIVVAATYVGVAAWFGYIVFLAVTINPFPEELVPYGEGTDR